MIKFPEQKLSKREVSERWEAFRLNLMRETPVPLGETEQQKQARIKRLKGNFTEFCKYYWPNYCTAAFAKFHLAFQKSIEKHDTIYIVRAWAREHAKSVVAGLFIPLFEMVNGRLDNMLMVSHNYDNAEELLMPLMISLESNQRFIYDYGVQKSWRGWEAGRFVTANGKSFRAIGAGQSPRGSRNEEKRPDYILLDDIDTDEESRNETRQKNKWNWIEQALYPTMSISGRKRFVFVGNIISKTGMIARAAKMADDYEVINILDKNGNPSWKEKNSIADVKYTLSKISYASGQKEYYNNPIQEGTVFTQMRWGKCPPLNKFQFLVAYCDSSYSNSRKNDFKAMPLIGKLEGKYYVITAFLEQTTLNEMVKWFFDIKTSVAEKTQIYYCIECNGFQDPWYQDVFMPALRSAEQKEGTMPISPDDRKKPDKFSRIEGNLEPLNRRGDLILNEDQKGNPHMQRLEAQFLAIEPALSAHDDGPDAVEGAVWIINNKLRQLEPIKVVQDRRNAKKW